MSVDVWACDGEKGLFRNPGFFLILIPPSPRAIEFSVFVYTKEIES